MTRTYDVVGLHCENCSHQLASLFENKDGFKYEVHHRKLEITDEDSFQTAQLLVESQGAYLIPEDEFLSTEEHEEGNHHHHHHHDGMSSRNIGIAFFLNLIFSIVEFIAGTLFNSYAITSDAVHDLGDAISIGIAWALQKISDKEPDLKYSDGYGRFSLLGSLFTGVVLLTGSIIMIIQTIPRLFNPQVVNYTGMFWLAIIAVAINVYSAYLMHQGSSKNERMLTLHMLEDILGWIAVLLVSGVLHFTDWYILDPILSLLIASFILYQTLPAFIDTIKIFMNKSPQNIDMNLLEQEILKIKHIHHLTNLHTHSIDGENHVFMVTIFVDIDDASIIANIKDQVRILLAKNKISKSIIEVVVDINKIVK